MRKLVFLSFLCISLTVTGYVYWFYYHSIGIGYLNGYCQQFSLEGDLFKTYEGVLYLQAADTSRGSKIPDTTQLVYFSVVDESVADSLEHCVGKKMKVHYTRYKRSLPWRGNDYDARNKDRGQYIVDRIDQVASE